MKTLSTLILLLVVLHSRAQIVISYDAQGNRVVLDNKGFKPKLTAAALSVKAGKSVTVTMQGCKGTPAWSISGNTGSLQSSTSGSSVTITSKNAGTISVQGACVYEGGCKSPLSEILSITFTGSGARTSADSTAELTSATPREPEMPEVAKQDFIIQPNPVQGQVIRMVTTLPESALFEIFEKNGRQVPHSQKRNGNAIELIPCNSIQPGIYIISTLSGGKMVSKRVLIE